ncbi:MAG: 2Fe-2S iron-sulfur cluster binding domain-containing protein, partial [Muribaculaceae bacterium]|nr:2Fe-2S iron-sulfur cluster binding domain-containing protein [Muribaculaceae bacterium]
MTFANILICSLGASGWNTILAGVGFFLAVTLLLVIVLLIAKKYLVQSGPVEITILNDDRHVQAEAGKSLLSTMADNNVFLPSACGGKGSCGQCHLQVEEGGGDPLPTEAVHFTRRELK